MSQIDLDADGWIEKAKNPTVLDFISMSGIKLDIPSSRLGFLTLF
jgi:hypothetical protein